MADDRARRIRRWRRYLADERAEARLYTDFLRPRDWADEPATHLWL